jgi:putative membrane protein
VTEELPDRPAPRRLSPLTPVVRAPILVLAAIGGSWQQIVSGDNLGVGAAILLALLIGGVVYGVASWVRTSYWISESELRIDTGVISRQSRRIRIDRLQGIDIVQPAVARLLGLAELRFDVASGSDREGSLAFMPLSEARDVRQLLLRRRDDLRSEAPDDAASADRQLPANDLPERELAALDLRRLFLSLALSDEAIWVGAGTLGLALIYEVTGSFAAVGGLVPLVIGVVIAAWRRFSSSYGFRLSESAAGLQVRRGLTSLSSQTIAIERIQGLVVAEPLLWQPFGWARLEVSVAGYKHDEGDRVAASSVLMPVAPVEEVYGLVRHVLGRDVRSVPLTNVPRRAAWRAPLSAWTMAFGQDDSLVVSSGGWWLQRRDIAPQERIQSARLRQGPLRRLLSLCDVHLDSPRGPVRVKGDLRSIDEARAFLDRHLALARARRSQAESVTRGELRRFPSGQHNPGDGSDPGCDGEHRREEMT